MTDFSAARLTGTTFTIQLGELHPLSLAEFFGWDSDMSAMFHAFNVINDPTKTRATAFHISEHTRFLPNSSAMDDNSVRFYCTAPFAQLAHEYDRCARFLNALFERPPFNPGPRDNMIADLANNDIAVEAKLPLAQLYARYNQAICPYHYNTAHLARVDAVMQPHYQGR